MFAVPVFAVIFVKLGNAVQESSRAAGCYQIRVDECLHLFTNTTTSVPYREQRDAIPTLPATHPQHFSFASMSFCLPRCLF